MPSLTHSHYNQSLLHDSHPAPLTVVLVSPRNPLNIGAAARAMANFGFSRLTVVAPYEPHWQEAKSAVGAENLLQNAKSAERLSEAIKDCTLVLGTGTLTHRKPEQPVVPLPLLAPFLQNQEKTAPPKTALVFGPEKRGLTRSDLALCHALVEIPTDPRQPSMNLGQAVAVCLYELTREPQGLSLNSARVGVPHPFAHFANGWDPAEPDAGTPGSGSPRTGPSPWGDGPSPLATREAAKPGAPGLDSETRERSSRPELPATAQDLDLLAKVIEQTMAAANYSPAAMRNANRHHLHLLLRRLALTHRDTRRILGLFRRILWRLENRTGPRGL
jgi:TrmH family RNA methyltransferase